MLELLGDGAFFTRLRQGVAPQRNDDGLAQTRTPLSRGGDILCPPHRGGKLVVQQRFPAMGDADGLRLVDGDPPGVRAPPPLASARTSPKLLGEVGVAEGSRLDEAD
jgi:hypothetical protein